MKHTERPPVRDMYNHTAVEGDACVEVFTQPWVDLYEYFFSLSV